jgi:hypothetical protein
LSFARKNRSSPRITNSISSLYRFLAGQKVKLSSPGPFQIFKGFSQTVTFSLNGPINCSDPRALCAVVVPITNPSTKDLAIDNCQIKWTNADWNVSRTLTIKALENFVDDNARTFVVKTEAVISNSEYFSGFNAPDITIVTLSRRTAVCSGTGDPHYVVSCELDR